MTAQLAAAVRARVSGPCADNTHVRVARKAHRCAGRQYDRPLGERGRGAIPGSSCREPIAAGSIYVECVDSTPAYASGDRYHVECAVNEGLLSPAGHAAVSPETRRE